MITLSIANGPTFQVAYTPGMNIQKVIEAAYSSAPAGTFTYALQ